MARARQPAGRDGRRGRRVARVPDQRHRRLPPLGAGVLLAARHAAARRRRLLRALGLPRDPQLALSTGQGRLDDAGRGRLHAAPRAPHPARVLGVARRARRAHRRTRCCAARATC